MMKKVLVMVMMVLGSMAGYGQTQLWGMAELGGLYNSGTIFKMNFDGSGFSVAYNFDSISGLYPFSSLINSPNGKLYGMASTGGMYFNGTIFSFDPTLNIYQDIYSFNDTLGSGPEGSLLLATDGKLYGMTAFGGDSGKGVLFSFDTTTNTYIKLVDFYSAIGAKPYWNSLIQATNGKLYGTTYLGGDTANDHGVLFSYDISSNTYSVLHIFQLSTGIGSRDLFQASNGKLYGLTFTGGTNSAGVLFSYDISTNSYNDFYNLTSLNGDNPNGKLIQATNGKLYGITKSGGTYDSGVLFSYDLTSNVYSKLIEFNGNGNGGWPQGSLFQASNGKLYGMTYLGGTYHFGVLFSFNPVDSSFTKLRDLDSLDGIQPFFQKFLEIQITTNLNESTNNLPAISLSPNPTTGTFTLSYHLSTPDAAFQLLDISGRVVYKHSISGSIGKEIIDASALSNGMYFYQLTSASESWQGKVVVEK